MDNGRYEVTTHTESGIINDPNDWSKEVGNPRYILDLLLSIINVSVQTVEIVNSLPKVNFDTAADKAKVVNIYPKPIMLKRQRRMGRNDHYNIDFFNHFYNCTKSDFPIFGSSVSRILGNAFLNLLHHSP